MFNPDETPIKTRAIKAAILRLETGLLNSQMADLQLRGESIRRGITVEELMGVYPSALILDTPETEQAGASTRGKVFSFDILIKLVLGPSESSNPDQVDRFVAATQAAMETGAEGLAGNVAGYTGLELVEEDGTVVGWITGGGEATPYHQQTDGATLVGAMVRYTITYRRVFGSPHEQW